MNTDDLDDDGAPASRSLVEALADFAEHAVEAPPEAVPAAALATAAAALGSRRARFARPLSKDEDAFLRVLRCIHALVQGQRGGAADARFTAELRRLADEAIGGAPRHAPRLSNREVEVLHLIARGMRSRDIAVRLHISPRTVEAHIAHLMKKLGARSQVVLLRNAIAAKLVDP